MTTVEVVYSLLYIYIFIFIKCTIFYSDTPCSMYNNYSISWRFLVVYL